MSATGSFMTGLSWETLDTETRTRTEDAANMTAIDNHDHNTTSTGKGVKAVQTASSPSVAGQLQVTGEDLKYYGTAVRVVVNTDQAQTITGTKTYNNASGFLFTDITAPSAPAAGLTSFYTVSGVPHFRANGGSDTALLTPSSTPTATNGQAFLGSDVTLNNSATFFSGPNTGSIGASGQVLEITAVASFEDTAASAQFVFQITDGSTVFAEVTNTSVSATNPNVVSFNAIVSPSAAATYTLKVKEPGATTGKLLTSSANGATANKATSISYKRLA